MSMMFSTPKTSKSSSPSRSIGVSSSSGALASSSSFAGSSSSSSFFSSSFFSSFFSSSFCSSPLAAAAAAFFSAITFSLASLAAFAAAAALALASFTALSLALASSFSLYSCIFFCQPAMVVANSLNVFKAHWPGTRSSTFKVNFLSMIHFLKYSWLLLSLDQVYRTSSKPSSFVGNVNLPNFVLKTPEVRSLMSCGKKITFFSSAVSSTFGGSSSDSSTSAGSSGSSSSSSSLSSSGSFSSKGLSAANAFAFLSAHACFFASFIFFTNSFFAFFVAFACSLSLFASSFFLFSSVCLIRNAASDSACFLLKSLLEVFFLNSIVGSPTSTTADFLKVDESNLVNNSFLSSCNKLPLTSMTM
mmetsp:Transcript_60324/g.162502  ORF Transcript_60324/g.162502 Transcript_60324/m.162502 type:complete len:360 (+) Transcript_60324:870-1949(+)